jgi:hypothetical protein
MTRRALITSRRCACWPRNAARAGCWTCNGAGEDYPGLAVAQKVDLGIGRQVEYLPEPVYAEFIRILERNLGPGVAERVGRAGFPAQFKHRIAAFAHLELGLHAVQIEMKPCVRIPARRAAVSPSPKKVQAMLQALVEFIEYVKAYP